MIRIILVLLVSFHLEAKDYIRLSKVEIPTYSIKEASEVKRTIKRLLLKSKKYQYLIADADSLSRKQSIFSIEVYGDYYKWNNNLQDGYALRAVLLKNKTVNKSFDSLRVPRKRMQLELQRLVLRLLSEKMSIEKSSVRSEEVEGRSRKKEKIKPSKKKRNSKKEAPLLKRPQVNSIKKKKKVVVQIKDEMSNDAIIKREKKKLKKSKKKIKQIKLSKKKFSQIDNLEGTVHDDLDELDIDFNNYTRIAGIYKSISISSSLADPQLKTSNTLNYYGFFFSFDTAASYRSKSRFILKIMHLKSLYNEKVEVSGHTNMGIAYSYKLLRQFDLQFELSKEVASFVNIIDLGGGLQDIKTTGYYASIFGKFRGQLFRPYSITLGTGILVAGELDAGSYSGTLQGLKFSAEVMVHNIWKKMFAGVSIELNSVEISGSKEYSNTGVGISLQSGYIF